MNGAVAVADIVEEVSAAELKIAHVDVERRSADKRGLRLELGALVRVEGFPLRVALACEDVEKQAFGVAFVEVEVATVGVNVVRCRLRLELAADAVRRVRRELEAKRRLLCRGRHRRTPPPLRRRRVGVDARFAGT